MEQKKTQCECPLAGFCNRHGVEKNSHLHKLCQTNDRYFQMWENCRGPKQIPSKCGSKENAYEEPKLPSIVQQATNLAKSTAVHIATGAGKVSQEEFDRRLSICGNCEFLVAEKNRCGKCGCFLQNKASWETSSCPIGRW